METGKQPVKAASIVKFNYVFQWNKNLQLPPIFSCTRWDKMTEGIKIATSYWKVCDDCVVRHMCDWDTV